MAINDILSLLTGGEGGQERQQAAYPEGAQVGGNYLQGFLNNLLGILSGMKQAYGGGGQYSEAPVGFDPSILSGNIPSIIGAVAQKIEPEKTVKTYKLFRTLKSRPGEVFPLFIDKAEPVPVGEWIQAKSVPTKGFAERPGWHSGEIPHAPQLLNKKGEIPPDRVWAEVEIPADVDWQTRLQQMGKKDLAGEVPEGGYYRFKGSNLAEAPNWYISGAMRVNRFLPDEEVSQILRREGLKPPPRAKE